MRFVAALKIYIISKMAGFSYSFWIDPAAFSAVNKVLYSSGKLETCACEEGNMLPKVIGYIDLPDRGRPAAFDPCAFRKELRAIRSV